MRILIALSGGLDSATLLAKLLNENHQVKAVSFKYESKHNRYEMEAAEKIADYYGIELIKKDVSAIFTGIKSDLLMSGGPIPEGNYDADSMKSTVVPARNMIFISIMAAMGVSLNAECIGLGVHAGDHHIYPDCRPDFIECMEIAVRKATEKVIKELKAPFLNVSKSIIVQDAIRLGVPIQLTRTCYKDQAVACGACGSCQERLLAFAENGVKDPILYMEDMED